MKKLLALLLALIMVFSLVACAAKEDPQVDEPQDPAQTENEEPNEEPDEPTEPEVEEPAEPSVLSWLFNNGTIPTGTLGGWRGEVLKNWANVVMEIIPNEEGKFDAIVQGGDLPDIMAVPAEKMAEMIEAGYVIALDEYMDQIPNFYVLGDLTEEAMEIYYNEYPEAEGKIYGVPLGWGGKTVVDPAAENFGANQMPQLRWDVYASIGYPEFSTPDELLDVLEAMVEACPENAVVEEEGADPTVYKTYGIVLDGDIENWDVNKWWCSAGSLMGMQGMTTMGKYMTYWDLTEGGPKYLYEEDSPLKDAIHFYFEANQRGILDPDSMGYTAADAWWGQEDYAMGAVSNQSMGVAFGNFMSVPFANSKIVVDDTIVQKPVQYWCITKDCDDIEGALRNLNFFLTPEAVFEFAWGPKGTTWDVDADNNLVLTDEAFEKAYNQGDFGGYVFPTGDEWAFHNCQFPIGYNWSGTPMPYGDGFGGQMHMWIIGHPSISQAKNTENEIIADYLNHYGVDTVKDLLDSKGVLQYQDAVTVTWATPEEAMQLQVDALSQISITTGWKMVNAKDEAEFDALWAQLCADMETNGGRDVFAWAAPQVDAAYAG